MDCLMQPRTNMNIMSYMKVFLNITLNHTLIINFNYLSEINEFLKNYNEMYKMNKWLTAPKLVLFFVHKIVP
ncbi:hypothetical protein DLJ74_00975 [Gracilibacillus dipsosauri]|uniref:Uncharacterized protein n=1 Tax=Gracilibacillus dipsosauri TaxID=178340 RepID=A0A317L4I8_9BACI|nr:hypothetical protein DLJ74_00975 [Gracilibacillus dipsosauri]